MVTAHSKKCIIVINLGRPGMGKTTLTKFYIDVYMRDRKFDVIIVFAATKHDGEWDHMPDQKMIFEKFDMSHLEKLKERYIKEKEDGNSFTWLAVFEDQAGLIDWYNKELVNTVCSFRHLGATLIINMQYGKRTSTVLWECASIVNIFDLATEPAFKAAYENCNSIMDFDSFREMKKFFHDNLKEHIFLHCILRQRHCSLRTLDMSKKDIPKDENVNNNGKAEIKQEMVKSKPVPIPTQKNITTKKQPQYIDIEQCMNDIKKNIAILKSNNKK